MRDRRQEERDAVFAEYERRLLADAGAADVSLDVAFRVWERVREAPEELQLLPDAKAVLAELHAQGITLGVISNMGLELDALLERLGVGEYLQVRATSGSAGVSKPHPRIFRLALAQAGAQPAEAVHVGDSIAADVEGARASGDHARVRAARARAARARRRKGRGVADGGCGARPVAAGERGADVNRIVLGDNMDVLPTIEDGAAALIYIDPPFNTGKAQRRERLRTVRDDEHGDRTGFQGKRYRTVRLGAQSFDDIFDDFLAFLEPRLVEAYRILSPTGSFFLHIDYREAHYCKVLLDALFGRAIAS